MNRNGHTIIKLTQKCQCGRPLFQLDNIWVYCEKCDYLERIKKMTPTSIVECCDCMDFMAKFPDKYFDLAIVDPPYFKGIAKDDYFNSRVNNARKENKGNVKFWDSGIPTRKYYDELKRASDHQIIWGCNYYNFLQPVGRIVWDKVNDNTPFSDCELASIDLIESVKIFRYKWNGMLQQDMKHKETRIHPTQKPVALYIWQLKNYAKPGDKILDTHLGSQSSRIAARIMGFDFWGCEIDPEYFDDGCRRFEKEAAQEMLFIPQHEEMEQPNLFNEEQLRPKKSAIKSATCKQSIAIKHNASQS